MRYVSCLVMVFGRTGGCWAYPALTYYLIISYHTISYLIIPYHSHPPSWKKEWTKLPPATSIPLPFTTACWRASCHTWVPIYMPSCNMPPIGLDSVHIYCIILFMNTLKVGFLLFVHVTAVGIVIVDGIVVVVIWYWEEGGVYVWYLRDMCWYICIGLCVCVWVRLVVGVKCSDVYDIFSERRIGKGSYGSVYYCKHKKTGEEFACKVCVCLFVCALPARTCSVGGWANVWWDSYRLLMSIESIHTIFASCISKSPLWRCAPPPPYAMPWLCYVPMQLIDMGSPHPTCIHGYVYLGIYKSVAHGTYSHLVNIILCSFWWGIITSG